MKWPTVEQSRAYFQMFLGAAIVVVLIYVMLGGSADTDTVLRVLMFILGIERSVNGVALAARAQSENGKQ